MQTMFCAVAIEHVDGHAGDPWNELADPLSAHAQQHKAGAVNAAKQQEAVHFAGARATLSGARKWYRKKALALRAARRAEAAAFGRKYVAEKDDEEAAYLFGDNDKLSPSQTQTMLMLKESMVYSRFKLKQISLSFSGASVFFFSPIRKDGTPMPSSVLKFDIHENVIDEAVK